MATHLHKVRELNDTGTAHVSLEGLARFLLRAESVGSSRIEGLEAVGRRVHQPAVNREQIIELEGI